MSTAYRHFGILVSIYGTPIQCIDLTKIKDKGENKLSLYYKEVVKYINLNTKSNFQLQYSHIDFKKLIKYRGK